LHYEERKGTEGFFGPSTPSSKKPLKSNSVDEQQKKVGGARLGHQGHGRSTVDVETADRVETIKAEKTCPDCGAEMKRKGTKLRTVIDCQPVQMEKIVFQLAGRLKGIPEKLVEEYRSAPVRHADETGWRTDGHNGYAWLFATLKIRLYRFRKTRSAAVPKEVFGDKPLPGVLVVDCYSAYNRMPCHLQYCYAHLLRDVKGLEKEFPENTEVAAFVEQLAPLLASAMALRSFSLNKREFKRQAKSLKNQIIKTTNSIRAFRKYSPSLGKKHRGFITGPRIQTSPQITT